MIENPPPISAEKLTYGCKRCSHKFTRMRYGCDYGYRSMECSRCGTGYFVDCGKDSVFHFVENRVDKQFSSDERKTPLDKELEIQVFEKEFEKTCDPCECGGTLKFAKAEMDLKCPECGSSALRIVRSCRKYAAGELKLKWATHKNWEEKKDKLKETK